MSIDNKKAEKDVPGLSANEKSAKMLTPEVVVDYTHSLYSCSLRPIRPDSLFGSSMKTLPLGTQPK